jgi:hypothetical protein
VEGRKRIGRDRRNREKEDENKGEETECGAVVPEKDQ